MDVDAHAHATSSAARQNASEPAAVPPYGLRDVQPHQALLAEQLELLVRVLPGLVDVRGERRDALAGDLPREVAHGALLVGEVVELAQRLLDGSRPSDGYFFA